MVSLNKKCIFEHYIEVQTIKSLLIDIIFAMIIFSNDLFRAAIYRLMLIFTKIAVPLRERIHNTQFSSKLKNWPDKHECYITKLSKGSTVTKTLAYWAHSQVTKKIKCCEYSPRCLFYKTFRDCCKTHLKRNLRIKLQLRCLYWRGDTQHNDIQHNDTQPKGLRCDTQPK